MINTECVIVVGFYPTWDGLVNADMSPDEVLAIVESSLSNGGELTIMSSQVNSIFIPGAPALFVNQVLHSPARHDYNAEHSDLKTLPEDFIFNAYSIARSDGLYVFHLTVPTLEEYNSPTWQAELDKMVESIV